MKKNPVRKTSWIKAAKKEFEEFPNGVKDTAIDALAIIEQGQYPNIAKPLNGLGSAVYELVLKERGEAYRVVYFIQIEEDIWVIDAFHKKSVSGIATPKHIIDRIKERIKKLKESLK